MDEKMAYYTNTVTITPTEHPTLGPTIQARIADLGKQIGEAGLQLAEARLRHRESRANQAKCEVAFAQIADELAKAINEHREGVPEGVPYGGQA